MLINLYKDDETDELVPMEISDNLINQLQALKDAVEFAQMTDDTMTLECPVTKITFDCFQHIMEFCKMYPDLTLDEKVDKELTQEDNEFFDKIAGYNDDYQMLAKLANVSDFLMISKLLEKITSYYANLLKGKSTQEMRDILGVEGDFTPQEQEKIQKELSWCDDSIEQKST